MVLHPADNLSFSCQFFFKIKALKSLKSGDIYVRSIKKS